MLEDSHVWWELHGSIRLLVYTLVTVHVAALVRCACNANHRPEDSPTALRSATNARSAPQMFWCCSLCSKPAPREKEA